jgi:hypothetical protein
VAVVAYERGSKSEMLYFTSPLVSRGSVLFIVDDDATLTHYIFQHSISLLLLTLYLSTL